MSALLEPRRPPSSQPPVVADSVLMKRVAKRDSAALIELERRHHASLYAQVYAILMDPVLAERVVQDTFSHVWFEAGRYATKKSPWTLLRDMARELARAERALHESTTGPRR